MYRSRSRRLSILLFVLLILAGCGGAVTAPHMEEDMHASPEVSHGDDGDMHTSNINHGVPDEAAAVSNPVEVTDASVAAGAQAYTINCAVCHGDSGKGDGPGAAALDPKPANLGADHVQENSDGALFYIISHGRTGTAMPAWEDVLSEQQRWETVNFLRTFAGK